MVDPLWCSCDAGDAYAGPKQLANHAKKRAKEDFALATGHCSWEKHRTSGNATSFNHKKPACAGACQHCTTKISAGNFTWKLLFQSQCSPLLALCETYFHLCSSSTLVSFPHPLSSPCTAPPQEVRVRSGETPTGAPLEVTLTSWCGRCFRVFC